MHVETRDGAITVFDAPNAVKTILFSINPAGAITGYYVDANGTHGFVRSA